MNIKGFYEGLLRNCFFGLFCGSIEVSINQPLIYYKNYAQQKLKLNNKLSTLYKGYMSSVINTSGFYGIAFGSLFVFKKIKSQNNSFDISNYKRLLVSFVGGCVAGIWSNIMDVILIQQQNFNISLRMTLNKLFYEYSLMSGLLKAVQYTSIRDGKSTFI